MTNLDASDVAILARLQFSTPATSDTIGAEVGLSPTAVQRRIKRLRDTGAITAEVAVIDPQVAGGHLTVIVQVVLERGRVDIVDGFMREVRAVPEVQQCYHITGEYDFMLIVTVLDMVDYDRLVRRLFYGNPHIRRFHTSVAIERVKVGLQVPIEQRDG